MYVGLTPEQRFLPGHLGMGLVEGKGSTSHKAGRSWLHPFFPFSASYCSSGYDSMGYEMSKPDLRAELEADLKLICEGKKDKSVVLRQQIQKYKQVFIEAVAKANK